MHLYFYSIVNGAALPVPQMDGRAGGLQAIIVKLDNQITDTVHKFILFVLPVYVNHSRADSFRHRAALSMETQLLKYYIRWTATWLSALSSFAAWSSQSSSMGDGRLWLDGCL